MAKLNGKEYRIIGRTLTELGNKLRRSLVKRKGGRIILRFTPVEARLLARFFCKRIESGLVDLLKRDGQKNLVTSYSRRGRVFTAR